MKRVGRLVVERWKNVESVAGIAIVPDQQCVEAVVIDVVEDFFATVFAYRVDLFFRQQIFQVLSPSAPTKWTSIREHSSTGVLSASEVSTTIDDGTNPNFGRGVNMLNFGA